jgi:hypothetical protein
MQITHPFTWMSGPVQKRAFIVMLILSIGTMISLSLIDTELKTPESPNGIVSFELAWTVDKAASIVRSWGQEGRVYAALSLGLDYLFLVCYAAAIALGCVLIGKIFEEKRGTLAKLGYLLAWAQFPAAILDAVENFGLIRILLGSGAPLWPVIAGVCASIKFTLVAFGLIYVFLGYPAARMMGPK